MACSGWPTACGSFTSPCSVRKLNYLSCLCCSGDEESDVSGGSTGSPSNAKTGGSRQRAAKRQRSGHGHGDGGGGAIARAASGGRAPRSHVATEQRRRDRINDGCEAARSALHGDRRRRCQSHSVRHVSGLVCCHRASTGIRTCPLPPCSFDQLRDLIPHKDKLDKAAFLQKTIDYICQLQVTCQTLSRDIRRLRVLSGHNWRPAASTMPVSWPATWNTALLVTLGAGRAAAAHEHACILANSWTRLCPSHLAQGVLQQLTRTHLYPS